VNNQHGRGKRGPEGPEALSLSVQREVQQEKDGAEQLKGGKISGGEEKRGSEELRREKKKEFECCRCRGRGEEDFHKSKKEDCVKGGVLCSKQDVS